MVLCAHGGRHINEGKDRISTAMGNVELEEHMATRSFSVGWQPFKMSSRVAFKQQVVCLSLCFDRLEQQARQMHLRPIV